MGQAAFGVSEESATDPVNLAALTSWMDAAGVGSGPITDTRLLTGGTQNILLRFRRGAESFVLRRPPHSPYLDGSETMRREARVLSALADSDVPHPRLIAACGDAAVLGAAFYLMEPVDGFAAPAGLPPLHAGSPGVQHAMGLALVDGLAALQRVDIDAKGLTDFGRPAGFLQRQTPRWLKQLESYGEYEGWRGRPDLPGIDKLSEWLVKSVPTETRPSIIHGDFHMSNVMFDREGPGLKAIVDWELATLGDPMLDLGWLLATWAEPDGSHPGCISVTPWLGFPTEAELVRRYADQTGRDVSAINWYVVMACFKLAILLEGTYARAAAGKADMAVGRHLHETSINLLARAVGRI